MKISIAQIEPRKGDVEHNMKKHVLFIKEAVSNNADVIMFPELSLTGYEPELANQLKTTKSDERLKRFQDLSDRHRITICLGLPTSVDDKIFVSMIIFQPDKDSTVYSKQYLYPTEIGIFTAANNPLIIHFDGDHIIAPAICYELSNEEHQKNANDNNATIYMASVLNSVNGVDADIEKLSRIAAKYKMTTFMSNYIGQSGGYECAGKSSIWNDEGELIAQLSDKAEGLLIYDTETKKVQMEYVLL